MSGERVFLKLNSTCQQALTNAVESAKLRENRFVELAHFLEMLFHHDNSDAALLAKLTDTNADRLLLDISNAINALPSRESTQIVFSGHLIEAVSQAWAIASTELFAANIRSAHLLMAMLRDHSASQILRGISTEFLHLSPEAIQQALDADALANSSEAISQTSTDTQTNTTPVANDALSAYAVDLTAAAHAGEMDPVLGRDDEIRQIIDVLMRRRQNNPILTGEAGVGKTAVIEGFAQRITAQDVPPALQNVALWMLDIGLMQAGASVKGEFENRLRKVIEAVQSSETPIILFVDEAHTLIGAGGNAGTGDAANLLKPALARGELRTIAATTWAEYKRHIEKDPALTRRFQVIKVEEPDEEKALEMIRGIAEKLAEHHGVEVLDEGVEAAVRLSNRYIPARQLPDKAVSLLDTACARVAVSLHGTPVDVESAKREITRLEVEQKIIKSESNIGLEHEDRLAQINTALEYAQNALTQAEMQWHAEQEKTQEILTLRTQIKAANTSTTEHCDTETVSDPTMLRKTLLDAQERLHEIQQESPMMYSLVDANAVAEVVESWTGIPVGKMVSDQARTILNLASQLSERVVGQDHAMKMLAERVQTSRAGLTASNKPVGVFMLAGPSGVGKTETALALADALYGGEQNVITVNMSEFQEAHTVSTLKGAPPGYVGYGEGGILTEAVRRRPYSVVLLDEIEKAHSDVHEVFFQVFDKGVMEDGEGREIDFRNTLILLTSNVGSELILQHCSDAENRPHPEDIATGLRPSLLEHFPAALLGRLSVIPYYPLSDVMIDAIAKLKLDAVGKRLTEAHGAEFSYDQAVLDSIRKRCAEIESGGRMIDAIINNNLLPRVSRIILERMIEDEPINSVSLTATETGAFAYTIS